MTLKTNKIFKKWQSPKNKKLLEKLIDVYGKYKYIQIIDWDGKQKYYKVLTKRIITKGIKAEELLSNKYGKEITQKVFKEKA